MSLRFHLIAAFFSAMVIAALAISLWPTEPGRVALLATLAGSLTALPAWFHNRIFLEPLRRLTGRVDQIAEGKLADKVYVGSGELRTLAQAINSLSGALAARFEQLASDRGRLAGILSGMIEGVVALDAADCVVFANSRAGLLLEFPADRAVGKKFWELVRQRSITDLVQAAAAAREPRRADIQWQAASPRNLAVYAAPLSGEESSGLIVVIHDVSELRRLERLRQEFVANVSHELKTPLAVIKACTETLLDGAADDAQSCRDFLNQIDEQADRLHALILDLLHLARVEAGDGVIEPAEVLLDQRAVAAAGRHRARAEARHQKLRVAEAAPTVAWAEEEAVDIILDNLIDNSIKYTPDGGTITICWGRNAASAWMEVTDTGVGIPEADLPRVFERFYRVDKARSRELGGTGLGLAIVKHLAQKMGGSVAAKSSVGNGTTFTVRLPAIPMR